MMSKSEGKDAKSGAGKSAQHKDRKRKLIDHGEAEGGVDRTEDDDQRLSKEARREQKRLKKEKREQEVRKVEDDSKSTPVLKDTQVRTGRDLEADGKQARKAAKDARKAEKKRLKAARASENKLDAHIHTETLVNADGISERHEAESFNYKESTVLQNLPRATIDNFLLKHHVTISDAGKLSHLRPIMEFSQFPGAESLPSPFNSFKHPTPIQAASWPFLLSGRDVIGVAETGSGKTLAFGMPCTRHIKALTRAPPKTAKGGTAKAVIVSPTRELAVQIHEQISRLAESSGLEAVCVYGGVPKDAQRLALKTAHIIVATPGRLNDLIEEQSAYLGNVNYVVLDEADRMLDKGFEQEIRKIISSTLPSASSPAARSAAVTRQTLMFTATWPPSVRELAASFMNDPVRINIGEDNPTGELRANARIQQIVEVIDPRGKEQRMLQLIKQYQSGKNAKDRILVFCLYKKEAQRVENFIRQRGLRVAGIHGDLSQDKRTKSLESFKSGETPLLVATDVAARGLDIPNVKVVLNVTFPLTAEDYVHRIGRTGRAGADGLAITLFTEHDKAQSGALINVLKSANQLVPDELLKFGTTVKKKQHDTYGAFYREDTGKKAEKIKFDD